MTIEQPRHCATCRALTPHRASLSRFLLRLAGRDRGRWICQRCAWKARRGPATYFVLAHVWRRF